MTEPGDATDQLIAWLEWYAQMGVTDSFGTAALARHHPAPLPAGRRSAHELSNRLRSRGTIERHRSEAPIASAVPGQGLAEPRSSPPPTPPQRPDPGSRLPVAGHARDVALACRTLDELARATAAFDGCALRQTATQCCFSDGNPEASLMLIGEAPGAEEDRQGKPFVGQSGQLLDAMMACIGLDRRHFYITNAIFWRPPGNRTPTPAEITICQPFLERQIELLQPKLLVFVGGIAARALLGMTEGVTKLRGKRFRYQNIHIRETFPAFVMFHPAYLLRQPLQKRLAWRDLLTLRQMLAETLAAGPKLNEHG